MLDRRLGISSIAPCIGLLLIACASAPTLARQVYEFVNPEHRQIFEKALTQINCPQCSGQSIAESPSAVAEGLRQLVFELAREGHSLSQIKDHLRLAYGEEILRQPSSMRHNLVLLGLPLLFLAFGAAFIVLSFGKTRDE